MLAGGVLALPLDLAAVAPRTVSNDRGELEGSRRNAAAHQRNKGRSATGGKPGVMECRGDGPGVRVQIYCYRPGRRRGTGHEANRAAGPAPVDTDNGNPPQSFGKNI